MNNFSIINTKSRTKFGIDSKIIFKVICVAFLLFFLVVLVVFPEICSDSFLNGLILFSTAVLPSLFPFMFITKMLTDFGLAQKLTIIFQKPFNFLFGTCGKAFYVFLMSILCGYPMGAKVLSDLVQNGQITKTEAEDFLPFCTSSGPLFIIGTVGVGMFASKRFGLILFAVHIISVVVVAFVVCNIRRLFRHKRLDVGEKLSQKNNLDEVLAKNMIDSCLSVLMVGGFISFFYLVIDILTKFKMLLPISALLASFLGLFGIDKIIATGISSGLVEMTRGCSEISTASGNFAGVAISAILAFGGISIILQSTAFLSRSKISILKFIGIKIMQTVVSVCIAILFFV